MKIISLAFAVLISLNAYSQDCPNYSMPLCSPGERVELKNPKDKCSEPICVKKKPCPNYAMPFCAPGETVGLKDPKDKCSAPVCIKAQETDANSSSAQ